MPTQGVNALGKKCADVVLKELDFPFDYSHEFLFLPITKQRLRWLIIHSGICLAE